MRKGYVAQPDHIDRAFQLSAELKLREFKKDGNKIKHPQRATVSFNAKIIYTWLKGKFPHVEWNYSIPEESSEKVVGTSKIKIFYKAGEIFCCQLEESDKKTAGRMWTTEAEVIAQDESVLLGVKISYITPEGENFKGDNIFSPPAFVQNILSQNGFCDACHELGKILRADSKERLNELYELITDENRLFPVVVFTDSPDVLKPVVEPELLLQTVGLIAHVAYIPGDYWTMEWKNLVGEDWDVYKGAVRTYYENVNFDHYYDLDRHPLATAQKIAAFKYLDKTGTMAFVARLIKSIQDNDNHMRIDWRSRGHKFLYAARREAEEAKREAEEAKIRSSAEEDINDILDELRAYDHDKLQSIIDSRNKEIQDLKLDIETLKKDSQTLEKNLQREKNSTYALEEQIKVLRQQLSDAGKTEEIIPADSDCNYLYIPKWAATYFPNKLVFTNRAHKSLKDAAAPGSGAYGGNDGKKIKKVYEWLQFLGTEYWQMKMMELDIQSVWKKAQNIGIYNHHALEQSPMSEITAGKQGKEVYDTYKGKEYPIKYHIKAGIKRDRGTLRINYFWDDEDKVVVICVLPWHLETPSSN